MTAFDAQHLWAIAPELILGGGALLLLLLEAVLPEEGKAGLPTLAVAALVGALAALPAAARFGTEPVLAASVFGDAYAAFARGALYAGGAVVVLASRAYLRAFGVPVGEFLTLLLLALTGAGLLVAAADLITLYVAVELMSISSYVLAGLLRRDPRSGEAALKYFLTGASSSAILLFGLSILYGLTATTAIPALGPALADDHPALVATALAFVLGGLAFKFAAVPFHLWVPDTYEGGPTPLAAFLSVGSEGAAILAALRLLGTGLAPAAERWTLLVAILAAASMTWGNLTALPQRNIKRMFAYSSIAQAGYLLVGVAAASQAGAAATLFYLAVYTFTNLGAFAVIMAVSRLGETVDAFAGLSRRSPLLAAAATLFFLSLIGVPFTAGFFGKFYLIGSAVGAGLVWLAVLTAVNSVVSVGYYWNVVRGMYLQEPKPVEGQLLLDGWARLAIVLAVAVTVAGGLVPGLVVWAQQAVAAGFVR